ncbi:beta-N-acetylhexosaminidase [soil metagenome]
MFGFPLLPALRQATDPLPIIPRPVSVVRQPGSFAFAPETRVTAQRGLSREAGMLRQILTQVTSRPKTPVGEIALRLDPKLTSLGAEGYRMQVRPHRIEITALKPAGVFYGIQTLRQLGNLFPTSPTDRRSFEAPCVDIEDGPRFAWRGLHLDVARHFMPKEAIFKFLDLMALHKLNTFHWHLTDDQGWRLEIKRYPKLTSVGSWRKDTQTNWDPPTFDGKPHSGFYTQKDAREVVAYAAARHINVVPEIEMPGHAQAAIASYPELGNTKRKLEVLWNWGVNDDVFSVDDTTISFLKNVLDEVMAIFPSPFIHIGGDEVPKTQWKASPAAQARMQALGLKDEDELQSWFVHQMDEYLTRKGRRLIGWDEILEGGLAPGAAVMSWRGIDGGIAAAKAGHDVVMASNGNLYFDYYQSRDHEKEPHAIGGYLPLAQVYGFEPIPAALTPEEAKHVLGVQGQIWTEYIATPKAVEYMAYPRACALAEIAWSPAEGKDFADFSQRLKIHVERLKALDVAFRPLDEVQIPDAGWKSGEIGEEWETRSWPITKALALGDYDVLFAYTGGECRLDIAKVEIWAGDDLLASDEHEGRTGSVDVANHYRFELKRLPPGPLTLRARVRVDGGRDSIGDIFLTPVN